MEDVSDYLLNVTEFPKRNVRRVYKPNNIAELKGVLEAASKNKTPLYPISTGHNWGLGSKLPVTDAEILHLENLDAIIEVNEELCYARIQPGVTQKQLADYLDKNHPSLMLNVTGSDAYSSILGNVIERGSGKNGHRADDLRELKVMLASGEEMYTGFGNLRNSTSDSFYKYGVGPDLTHLFTQSNYGIITEGVINLMVKQPFKLFLVQFDHSLLSTFLSQFSHLVRTNIVGNSLELDSMNDPKIFELFERSENLDKRAWVGWFVIYGEKDIRDAKAKHLSERMSAISNLKIFDSEEDNGGCPSPVDVRLKRYSGEPSDHSLIATAKSFGVDLKQSNPDIDLYKQMPGFRCVLPVIPLSRSAKAIIDFIYDFSDKLSIKPAISLIALNPYSLEVFVRTFMDRKNEEEIRKASHWSSQLLIALKEMDIFPYRIDIENMIPYLSGLNDPMMRWKKEIKNLFDPDQIISPNRFII